jgi:peroxiredoxin
VQLQQDQKVLADAGVQVVAISYDPVDALAKFAEKEKITYPLLSDPGSKTIAAYLVANKEAKGTRIDGVPYPGTFILDAKGVVRAKLFHDGYKARHTGADLARAAEGVKD